MPGDLEGWRRPRGVFGAPWCVWGVNVQPSPAPTWGLAPHTDLHERRQLAQRGALGCACHSLPKAREPWQVPRDGLCPRSASPAMTGDAGAAPVRPTPAPTPAAQGEGLVENSRSGLWGAAVAARRKGPDQAWGVRRRAPRWPPCLPWGIIGRVTETEHSGSQRFAAGSLGWAGRGRTQDWGGRKDVV